MILSNDRNPQFPPIHIRFRNTGELSHLIRCAKIPTRSCPGFASADSNPRQ
jgi:hypothetical protein